MVADALKCVVIGDGNVGKTCLLIRYAKDEFPSAYVPTVFDNYVVSIPIGNENVDFHLFDTAGQESYDQLRKLTFTNTDVFLVCFAVDLWSSFINVQEIWIPELRKYCPNVPFILVGTKIDQRNNPNVIRKLNAEGTSLISTLRGENLAQKIGAVKYLECSALTKENVDDVLKEAIIVGFYDDNHKKSNKPITSQADDKNVSYFQNSAKIAKDIQDICTRIFCCLHCRKC